jgi:hypothetical protein
LLRRFGGPGPIADEFSLPTGAKFDTLYAGCGSTLYRRKVKVSGANGWDAPNKPAEPRL